MVGGMDGGGMHDKGHAWQGVCLAGGVHGRVMHGRGHVWQESAWQERQPLQWMVCILLECILVIVLFKYCFIC